MFSLADSEVLDSVGPRRRRHPPCASFDARARSERRVRNVCNVRKHSQAIVQAVIIVRWRALFTSCRVVLGLL